MSILKDVLSELWKMFVGDAWLTAAILAVVAGSAAAIGASGLSPLAGGAVLLFGCIGVLIAAVRREACHRSAAARR